MEGAFVIERMRGEDGEFLVFSGKWDRSFFNFFLTPTKETKVQSCGGGGIATLLE